MCLGGPPAELSITCYRCQNTIESWLLLSTDIADKSPQNNDLNNTFQRKHEKNTYTQMNLKGR